MAKYGSAEWNVNLWIQNDEGLYKLAQRCKQHGRTNEKAAKLMLEALTEYGATKTPDGAKYTLSNLKSALNNF